MSIPHEGSAVRLEVQGVTTAAAPRSADRSARMRVYLLQMGLRTACFVAALFAHGWWQLAFILAAMVLPYIAVVGVNNTAPAAPGSARAVTTPGPALPARPTPTAPRPEPVVLTGEVVDEDAAAPRALPTGHQTPEAA